jgi:hypothetical protein
MDLQKMTEILPNNGKWKIKNEIVYVRYMAWIPIINMKDEHLEVYFDTKLNRYLLQIIPKLKEEFYLVSPILSDPKNKFLLPEERHKVNILNMISNYSNPLFFEGFKKIDFDLITHLVLYCKKFDSMLLIKEVYDHVNKSVQSKDRDYYTNKQFFTYTEEIREEFNGLYRQIKLADLLN